MFTNYIDYNVGSGANISSQLGKQLQNINKNTFYRGVVVDINDPEKIGRVKIRIPSFHGVSEGAGNWVPNAGLPWAVPATWNGSGNNMGEYNLPTVGTRVLVTFENGDLKYPLYFGGIPTKIGKEKIYKGGEHILDNQEVKINTDDYNLDIVNGTERVVFKSFKGATLIIDDFDGAEYIKIIDQAGQTFIMGNSGDSLPRRETDLGISSESFMELNNNRGESIRISEGVVKIEGDTTIINSPVVQIPNWSGTGMEGNFYTKLETDALLSNKNRVFFATPTVPYTINDIWISGTTVYKCTNTRKNGSFNPSDWVIDVTYTTPDQVSQSIEVSANAIRTEMSSTYVVPAYVDSKLQYSILISSSNGNIFKNGIIGTTLTAYVRQGNIDVSSTFQNNQFIWSRTSDDTLADLEWNMQHIGGSRSIVLTESDVVSRANFKVDLVDEISALSYISSGLIEIFDGYTEPNYEGQWLSMIRSNIATIPTSGVSYDSTKHGYLFTGTSNALTIYKPIEFKSGQTYEFVTELSPYTSLQYLLSSTGSTDAQIQNRIGMVVAGYLSLKRNGYIMNIGDAVLTRKSCISLRYVSEDLVEVYYNGDYAGRYVQSNWNSISNYFNNIGKYCSGYIYSIRVYNRLLEEAEIVNNYNQDLERFY